MADEFEYIDSILKSKVNLITDEHSEKGYSPFKANRHLSYFLDTVLYANDMNMFNELGKKLQFDYLINSVRPAKRYAKWHKAGSDSDLKAVMEYYQESRHKAQKTLQLLSKEQLNEIKQELIKGGIGK
jgi:hypothetical protein